jgi:RHS repeat-associated protein
VTVPSCTCCCFSYDPDGDLTGTQRPNGTSASYGYDSNDAVTSIDDITGHTDYSRTAEELLSAATPPGQAQQSYGYDGAQRLTSAGSTTYGYDAADNITQTTDPSGQAVSQSFDSANELGSQSIAGITTNTFGYDQNGNRTSGTDQNNKTTAYTYDQANQLIDYEGPDHTQPNQSASDQYVYDGDGLRQTKAQDNLLTNEVWDSSGDLPLMIEDGPTAYIAGPDGLAIEQITQDGTARYYSHDQLGTTTALTNQAGDTTATYQYDAYGNPNGPAPAVQQPFAYAGQYTDAETGLQYVRARYYEPATGQLLTRDPLANLTRQRYSYAGDDPSNLADPTGLCGFRSLGSFGDCFNPVSSGNLANQGAQALSKATGGAVNLPWLLTRPALVDAGAVAVCAVPFVDAGCLPALGAAWSVSTSSVVAAGIATHFCDVGILAAQEAINTLLLAGGGLGRWGLEAAGQQGAPVLPQIIIRGGFVAAQGTLDAILQTKGG